MINGIHALVYVKDAERARAFFRDTLEWPSVDAGHGWLIFAMPPGEIAAHPTEGGGGGGENGRCDLYFMCDDVQATVAQMKAKGVEVVRPVSDQGWGLVTAIRIPGGGEMGLYQPRHPIAHGLKAGGRNAKKTAKKAAKKSAKKKTAASRGKPAKGKRR